MRSNNETRVLQQSLTQSDSVTDVEERLARDNDTLDLVKRDRSISTVV